MKNKTENFNLSEKIESANVGKWGHSSIYLHQDVKEFIRRLKEELGINPFDGLKFCQKTGKECGEIIDTLAGDKLT